LIENESEIGKTTCSNVAEKPDMDWKLKISNTSYRVVSVT